MLGALHHMQDPATAVSECARVLAPGGGVCIIEPNAAMLEKVREEHPDHPDPTDPTPFVPSTLTLETYREERFDVYLLLKRAA